MNVRAIVVIALFALIAGCATQGGDGGPEGGSGNESVARTRARVHTELASGYFELGNLGVALQEVNEALRADSDYGPAYNVSGLIHAELKEDGSAEKDFKRALAINPLDSDANNNYGLFLCQRKREDEGIRYFLAALKNPLYRTPERSYVNAGLCSRGKGDLTAAVTYFEKALKLQPNLPQALYQLADILYARGNYIQAKEYATRVVRIAPTPEGLWLAVRLERKLGDRDAEASYALQLQKKFPKSKEARALNSGQRE